MPGFNQKQKREIVFALRRLRRGKRVAGERLTYHDIENLIWGLPPTFLERFFSNLHKKLSRLQQKF